MIDVEEINEIINNTCPDKEKKEASVKALERAVEKKDIRQRDSVWEAFKGSISFVSAGFWVSEGVFLLLWLLFMQGDMVKDFKIRELLVLASAASVYLALPGIAELYRTLIWGMAELEQTCCFCLEQIWAGKLLLCSGVNLVLLAVLAGSTAEKTGYAFYQTGIYAAVPFLTALTVYLKLLFAGYRSWIKYGAAFGMLFLAAWLPSFHRKAYEQSAVWIWLLALAAAGIAAAIQVRASFQKTKGGQALCWNCH